MEAPSLHLKEQNFRGLSTPKNFLNEARALPPAPYSALTFPHMALIPLGFLSYLLRTCTLFFFGFLLEVRPYPDGRFRDFLWTFRTRTQRAILRPWLNLWLNERTRETPILTSRQRRDLDGKWYIPLYGENWLQERSSMVSGKLVTSGRVSKKITGTNSGVVKA